MPALILFAAGGIGVSVLDVRRPLKSTEDAVTKVPPAASARPCLLCKPHPIAHRCPLQEADRVSNGGAGGATLVHQRLLDNGAEVSVRVARLVSGSVTRCR